MRYDAGSDAARFVSCAPKVADWSGIVFFASMYFPICISLICTGGLSNCFAVFAPEAVESVAAAVFFLPHATNGIARKKAVAQTVAPDAIRITANAVESRTS